MYIFLIFSISPHVNTSFHYFLSCTETHCSSPLNWLLYRLIFYYSVNEKVAEQMKEPTQNTQQI